MDKTAPVLQSWIATNCKLLTSKVQAKASATNDYKPGIPVVDDNSSSTCKDIDPAKQKSKLFGKRKSLGSVFLAKEEKQKKKVVFSKERRKRLMTNKKKKHRFRKKSQTANYAEYPKEGCPV